VPEIIPTHEDIDTIVNEAVLAEYWERGYWISPKLFSDEQITRLRHAHERIWVKDFDHLNIQPQYGIHEADVHTPKLRSEERRVGKECS
jgi:hypothetical protein